MPLSKVARVAVTQFAALCGTAAAEPRGRSSAPLRSPDAHSLVQHVGVREPREFHVRQLASIGASGTSTTDLTLEKTVAFTDAVKFDVRVEAYNLLNRTNFNIPGFTLGAADFGVISSARPARTIQLGARLSS
jgi:hypothetical protein